MKTKNKGFTLIELAVTISIILILLVILITKGTATKENANLAGDLQNIKSVDSFLTVNEKSIKASGTSIEVAQSTIDRLQREKEFNSLYNPHSKLMGVDSTIQTTDAVPSSIVSAIIVYSVQPSEATMKALPIGTLVIYNGVLMNGTSTAVVPPVIPPEDPPVEPPAEVIPTTVVSVTTPVNLVGVAGNLMDNNGEKIVRGKDGNLYMVYCYGATYAQVNCKKSTDNGATWVDLGFPQIVTNYQYTPSIAIDSSNNLYVVWSSCDPTYPSYYQVKFTKYNGTSWTAPIMVATIPGFYGNLPVIAVGKDNSLNVIWSSGYATEDSQIKYVKSTDSGVTWTPWINISPTFGKLQEQPSMVMDSANNIHVVWDGLDSGIYKIYYSKFDGTSWSTALAIQPTLAYSEQCPCITVDSSDNLHVVWEGYDSANTTKVQIKYSKYNGTSWSTWINISTDSTYIQQRPTIAVDYNNNIHVGWEGLDSASKTYRQIKYKKFDGTSWGAMVKYTTSSTNHFDTQICRNYKYFNEPIIVWRDAGGYVKFRGIWLVP